MSVNGKFSFNPEVPAFSFSPQEGVANYSAQNRFACNNPIKKVFQQHVVQYNNLYGMDITYYSSIYDLKKHNFLYGEEHSGFNPSRQLKGIVELKSYGAIMTSIGYQSEEEINLYIPVPEFERAWGDVDASKVFPMHGDVFYINDSACDRPLRQSERLYTVNERSDTVNPVDFLGGHYVYKLDCRRFDYSGEEGIAPESSPFDKHPLPENNQHAPQTANELLKRNYDNSQSSSYGNYL